MYLRAAELGWTFEEFETSTFSRFIWQWSGYYRRIERSNYAAAREMVAIVYNTNVKKGKQKSGSKIMPLSIDFTLEFTFDDALAQFEKVKTLGWLN